MLSEYYLVKTVVRQFENTTETTNRNHRNLITNGGFEIPWYNESMAVTRQS